MGVVGVADDSGLGPGRVGFCSGDVGDLADAAEAIVGEGDDGSAAVVLYFSDAGGALAVGDGLVFEGGGGLVAFGAVALDAAVSAVLNPRACAVDPLPADQFLGGKALFVHLDAAAFDQRGGVGGPDGLDEAAAVEDGDEAVAAVVGEVFMGDAMDAGQFVAKVAGGHLAHRFAVGLGAGAGHDGAAKDGRGAGAAVFFAAR